tara:strand:- start:2625 stop:3314 length:690 start_codon:yes stop_codon:yes gene_type:complete
MTETTQTTAVTQEVTNATQVKISGIVPTLNPNVFQLVLRSENTKPSAAGSGPEGFSMFMSTYSQNNVEKRVKYHAVDANFLEGYNLADVTRGADGKIQSVDLHNVDPISGEMISGAVELNSLQRVKDIKNPLNGNSILPERLPEHKLVLTETFVQKFNKDKNDMITWSQKPKQNPATKQTLCNQGKPIYRNVDLTFDMNKEDVYIKHDGTEPASVNADPFSTTSDGLMG